MGSKVTLTLKHDDGSVSTATVDPDPDGGYSWAVPEGVTAINGIALPDGSSYLLPWSDSKGRS